ncbi:hypothetical protein IM792_13770 [Mucilaginibacter sp. JRF]|uniref:hypothetical protein n=1 Tax=Mucilaginibacter sp. JRF TaxID=2780088 RepID=UPI00187EFC62|nr:hypothetical protein [Mucilaginibacter sp. JRF]MBE9585518.1 hypothetical protein [Mucilaginibacter sp. JRF]
MHTPYQARLGRIPNFRVKYRFKSEVEGGRKSLPYQGIRCDFSYDEGNSLFMIWPEFEDEHRNIILNADIPVPSAGTALMWIMNPESIPFHQEKIQIGTTGFFREGANIIAECEVMMFRLINSSDKHSHHQNCYTFTLPDKATFE